MTRYPPPGRGSDWRACLRLAYPAPTAAEIAETERRFADALARLAAVTRKDAS